MAIIRVGTKGVILLEDFLRRLRMSLALDFIDLTMTFHVPTLQLLSCILVGYAVVIASLSHP